MPTEVRTLPRVAARRRLRHRRRRAAGEYQCLARAPEGFLHHADGGPIPGKCVGIISLGGADTRGAHDRVDVRRGDGVRQTRRVAKVAHDRIQTKVTQFRCGPLGTRQSEDFVSPVDQRFRGRATDVAGGARDQNLHRVALNLRLKY